MIVCLFIGVTLFAADFVWWVVIDGWAVLVGVWL